MPLQARKRDCSGWRPTVSLVATWGPSVTSARRSLTTTGEKYRVSPEAGRASPSPANFEGGSVPRLGHRPGLRWIRG